MNRIIVIRPRPVDPALPHIDPERDFIFVREHIRCGWSDTLTVSEVDLDGVLSSLTDCAQLSLAMLRNVEKLNRRVTETLI